MKIMMPIWHLPALPNPRRQRTIGRGKQSPAASILPSVTFFKGDYPMQWQTPTAVDFRFGFEITMYVANR